MNDKSIKCPRLVAILGTRAQTIKMAPLLVELENRDLPFRLLLTGQHRETIQELLAEFGVKTPSEVMYDGPEIKGILQAAKWMLRMGWMLWVRRNDWAPKPRKATIVLAHGDTFSTLLAAGFGWLARARVAHVEAGLRSYNLRHPFPEELTRLLVGYFSDIAYCPGQWACGNLNPHRKAIVDTGANTILDALRKAIMCRSNAKIRPDVPYAVVSIHRFENLYSRERLDIILRVLQQLSEHMLVIVVLHPTTRKRLIETGELAKLENNPAISLRDRMTYVPFIQMIGRARFVISDGGSNQEELSYLGVPTLLMRMATERQEGLQTNIVLSRFAPEQIRMTIEKALAEKSIDSEVQLPDIRPVSIIADDLCKRLFR